MKSVWQRMLQCYWQGLPTAFLLAPWQSALKETISSWEKMILCHSPQPEGACACCASCNLYALGSHPDCFSILNDEDSDNISIEDIRAITDFVHQTTHQGGRRIVTLVPIDALSLGATNALLKTLEEPPSGTFFLLAAKQLSRVLPTIRSRCAFITVPYPSHRSLPRDNAQALLWQAFFIDNAEMLIGDKLQKYFSNKPQEMLHSIYYWIADLIRYTLHQAPVFTYTQDENEQLKQYAKNLNTYNALMYLEYVSEALKTVTMTGINKGLLLGSVLYRWRQILQLK